MIYMISLKKFGHSKTIRTSDCYTVYLAFGELHTSPADNSIHVMPAILAIRACRAVSIIRIRNLCLRDHLYRAVCSAFSIFVEQNSTGVFNEHASIERAIEGIERVLSNDY